MTQQSGAQHCYRAVADAIVALLSPLISAAIHDVASDEVIYVAGFLPAPPPGDPATLAELGGVEENRFVGPIDRTSGEGRRIRSVMVALPGEPASMLCLHADVSRFEAIRELLDTLLSPPNSSGKTGALIRLDWHESLSRFIANWVRERDLDLRSLRRTDRRLLIAAINQRGGFNARHAPAYVAKLLSISRATVYAQLAELRQEPLGGDAPSHPRLS